MGDLNWVDFFEEQSIKCGMERVSALIVESRLVELASSEERDNKISG